MLSGLYGAVCGVMIGLAIVLFGEIWWIGAYIGYLGLRGVYDFYRLPPV